MFNIFLKFINVPISNFYNGSITSLYNLAKLGDGDNQVVAKHFSRELTIIYRFVKLSIELHPCKITVFYNLIYSNLRQCKIYIRKKCKITIWKLIPLYKLKHNILNECTIFISLIK